MADNFRLLIIPCLNPDGRERFPFEITPSDPDEAVRYKQGIWKDGTLAEYNVCTRVHPISDAVSYMGGYFNDGGVNLYADNYFSPMSPENRALFSLVDNEAPDIVLFLHTGCHKHGKLLQPYYVPAFIEKHVMEFDEKLHSSFKAGGYTYYSLAEHGPYSPLDDVYPPPRLPMETAIHFACGALSIVYESKDAVCSADSPFFLEHILDCHFTLFEQAALYAQEFQQACFALCNGRGLRRGF